MLGFQIHTWIHLSFFNQLFKKKRVIFYNQFIYLNDCYGTCIDLQKHKDL